MSRIAIEFVQSQLFRAEGRLKPYLQSIEGRHVYPKRFAFFRVDGLLKKFISSRAEERWVVMPGISGVGKTTILAQLYRDFKARFQANNILFVSLDEAALSGISLKDIIDAYESILGVSYEELKQPVMILIDEAHRDPKWSSALKVLWGRSKKVFTICTGSSAVLLAPHLEDVGRRITVEKLYPLSFLEYEMIKRKQYPEAKLKQKIKELIYTSSDAASAFLELKKLQPEINKKWASYNRADIAEYLNIGTVPFALQSSDEASVFLAIDRIIDKLIQKDILELGDFKVDTHKQIKPLLLYLAQGNLLSVSKAGSLFNLTKNTLQDVLDVLVKAEILIKVPPFKAENKASKYLFMCPALRNALLDISGLKATQETRRGDVLEDAMALHLYREFVAPGYGKITHDPAQGGADFILDLRIGKRIVIEIGASDKRVTQAQQTLEKAKADYGIVYNTDPLAMSENSKIIKIPHDFFFLM